MRRFLSGMAPATPAVAAGVQRLPELAACDVLLCGPSASGRASLALHFALQAIAASGLPALLLCRQEGLEASCPVLPHGWAADDPLLELLHIKYVRSAAEVQRWACCLHLLRGAYAAIVVEDVSGIARSDDRNTLVRTLALLVEGVRAYRAAVGCGPRCPLLVTEACDEARRPRYIYDRWLPHTLLLAPAGTDGVYRISQLGPGASGGSSGGQQQDLGSPRGRAGAWADGAVSQLMQGGAPAGAPGQALCTYRVVAEHLVLESIEHSQAHPVRAAPAQLPEMGVPYW